LTVEPSAGQALDSSSGPAVTHHTHRALNDVKGHLRRSTLRIVGYALVVYLVLRLIPTLNEALSSLKRVSWGWVVGAISLEVLSETGFVVAWRRIVDPDRVLERDGRGWRMDQRVAWAQLGGGLVVPGGSLGGMGVGGWILHRFGMPTQQIAERQLNLSFLNTGMAMIALVVFGVGLAAGIFAGENNLLLTLLPAAIAAAAIAAAVMLAPRAGTYAGRLATKHPKVGRSITTLANAVEDTKVLFRRSGTVAVLGAAAYLGFELLILWLALLAVHAHPTPGFAVVVMAYIIGALGGSLPLPASIGTIGGIAGMLIVYGVDHNPAVAGVLLHQAIGLLVPLTGGAISYLLIRRQVGPVPIGAHREPA
jgi:uncharacterized membrane protein YbhN (UPF0104 family)